MFIHLSGIWGVYLLPPEEEKPTVLNGSLCPVASVLSRPGYAGMDAAAMSHAVGVCFGTSDVCF